MSAKRSEYREKLQVNGADIAVLTKGTRDDYLSLTDIAQYKSDEPSCDSHYFYYVLNSGVFDYYLPTYLTSTVNQLTGNNFGQMYIPLMWLN